MLRAVVEARSHRYLMLNAPEAALPAIRELVRPRVPSVLPLAEPGWSRCTRSFPPRTSGCCCPKLEKAGASSILLVPVERMVG